MYFLFRHYLVVLLAMMLVGGLAACKTTTTTGADVSRRSSTETPAAAEQVADEPEEMVDESAVVFDESGEMFDESGTARDESAAILDESTEAFDEPAEARDGPVRVAPSSSDMLAQPEPQPLADEMDTTVDSGAAGAAPQADVFEAPLEFPIQPYEIDEPREIAGASDTDPEIERLRQELAATESELERIQAEEAQRQYSPAESLSEGDSGSPGDEIAAIAPQQTETTRVPDEPSPRANVADLPGKPSESSIYFGYDQATLEQQYERVLIAHARFMKSNPQLTVEIQGNCDERGSREYNIALGQQRALSIKRALELLGVEGHRIETVSFGSEKPVAFGHDEDSWRLNRRADIVYY